MSKTIMEYWKLVIPICLNNILISIIGSVDVFLLSYYSDNAVAATGIVGRVIYILSMLFDAVSVGATIIIAQYLGAKNNFRAREIVRVSLAMNVVQGIIATLLVMIGAKGILNFLAVEQVIYNDALVYLRYMGGTLIFKAITSILSGVFRCYGLAKYGLIYSVIANGVNIIGDYLVIFNKINIGKSVMEGVSIFTFLGYFVCAFLYIWKIRKHEFFKLNWDPHIIKAIFKVGIPSSVESISYNLSQFLVTLIFSNMGWQYVSAQVYAMNIMGIVSRFSYSTGEATGIMVGKYVGAKKHEDAYSICKRNTLIAEFFTLVVNCLLVIALPIILKNIFTNQLIIEYVMIFVIFECISLIAKSINFSFGNALKATGDVYFPSCIGVIFTWVIGTFGAYFIGITLETGIEGICFMFLMDESIRAILMIRRWTKRKWENKKVIT